MQWEEVFIDPKELPQGAAGICQLTFLLVSYGYILFTASNMISGGSELLLLTPLAGLVGSVVLPVLGAVPDGAIVLFSGMGPNAQEQLSVGVGALAGSTIMLTTIPWFLSIIAGRVDIENGLCSYKKPKLSGSKAFMTEQGVEPTKDVAIGAKIMMMTAVSYLLIQGPAMFLHGPKEEVAEGESKWALAALIVCLLSFFIYLVYQYRIGCSGQDAAHELMIEAVIVNKIKEGRISLLGALQAIVALHPTQSSPGEESRLLPDGGGDPLVKRLKAILHPFFYRYDLDGNGHIDNHELGKVMSDLGINARESDVEDVFKRFDADSDGKISFQEFAEGVGDLVRDPQLQSKMVLSKAQALQEVGLATTGEDEEDEDEEEMPEEFVDLPPHVQQQRIFTRSLLLMGAGTALVLIFSDPMVGVMSEFGVRIGVPGFYISFILAPLASNASELIASYNYALKKTSKSITISLTALLGAGSMNNTFTLGVFMMLLYTQKLAWQFTAETLAILIAELLVGMVAMVKVQKMWMAFAVLAIYPASLLLVMGMESIGFD